MKLPIIINANGDVEFYETLEKAQLDIEPTDVENNEYVIYDGEGLLLNPVVIDDPVYDVVRIYPTDEFKKDELIDLLVDFFSEVGHDSLVLRTMSLEELVAIGLKYFHDLNI